MHDKTESDAEFEALKAAYFATVRRAALSWYTRSERLRRQGALRRYRVGLRRHRAAWAATLA